MSWPVFILNANINSGDTTIVLDDIYQLPSALIPGVGRIQIGDEVISFAAVTVGVAQYTLNGCIRGVDSTTAASHTAGDSVVLQWPAHPREILYRPINNFVARLLTGIDPNQDSIQISNGTNIHGAPLPMPGLLSIDQEVIRYETYTPTGAGTAVSLNRVTRGADRTQRRPHSADTLVEGRWVAGHHNILADAIYGLMANLGADFLNSAQSHGVGTHFASLAAAIRDATPYIVAFPAVAVLPYPGYNGPVIPHSKGRIVSVQVYTDTSPYTTVTVDVSQTTSEVTLLLGPTHAAGIAILH